MSVAKKVKPVLNRSYGFIEFAFVSPAGHYIYKINATWFCLDRIPYFREYGNYIYFSRPFRAIRFNGQVFSLSD